MGLDIGLLVSVAVGFLMVLIWLSGRLYRERQIRKGIYSVVWKRTKRLKPSEVMFDRGAKSYGYRKYFYPINEVDAIVEKIKARKNVIVFGNPLSGKTRTVFEAFKKLWFTDVIIPQFNDVTIKEFNIPRHNKFWRRKVLYLDDLQKYVEKKNFEKLFGQFTKDENKTVVVATCRTGEEFAKVAAKLGSEIHIFDGGIIELGKFDEEAAKVVAKETGKDMPTQFDGNIGTILLGLEDMKNRFDNVIPEEEKAIMRAIKRLYHAGIYRGREVFLNNDICEIVKHTCGRELNIDAWNHAINNLEKNGFITKKGDGISAEEAYLTDEVIEEPAISNLVHVIENMVLLIEVFSGDPEALEDIAMRAYLIGTYHLTEAVFLKIAIKACGMAAELYKGKGDDKKAASALLNYATRLNDLGDVEDKGENNREAIRAYNAVLKFYTIEDYPEDYAMTQNNLGGAYTRLGEAVNKAENCRLAIAAFEEALKVYTLDKFPMQYAATQNNLAIAYRNLGEVENKAENCRLAITAFEEALKVYTVDKFPMDYAMTQNNLAVAYNELGNVEDKAGNNKLAIAAYEETLKVYTLDKFPMDYAMTQNNLAVAYRNLGDVENKAENCKIAIAAYEEALKVYKLDKFPMDYAMTQANMGIAYVNLAQEENGEDNLRNTLQCWREAAAAYETSGLLNYAEQVKGWRKGLEDVLEAAK